METDRRSPGAAEAESNESHRQGDRETLRLRHGVRLVTPEEEGFALQRLPNGVYGFTQAPGQAEIPVFAKGSVHSFEAHKDPDGAEFIVGFITAEHAQRLASDQEGAEMTLYPDEWGDAREIVAIALTRMAPQRRSLTREDGNPLRFTLV